MKPSYRSAGTVAAVTALVVLTAQAPAFASDAFISWAAGSASFDDNGDVLSANDTATDGISVRARVNRNGAVVASVTDGSPSNGPETINLALQSGGSGYALQLCTVNGGAIVSCSFPEPFIP